MRSFLAATLLVLASPAMGAPSAQLLELSAQEQVLLDEMAAIETRLLVLHTELEALHIQERDLESHLLGLDQEVAEADSALEDRRDAVRRRVRAMYMNSEQGFLQLLFSARDIGDLLQGSRYLAHVLRGDEQVLAALRNEALARDELRAVRELEFQALQERIAQRQSTQQEQRDLRERRTTLLGSIRSERRIVAIEVVESERAEMAVREATHASEPLAVPDPQVAPEPPPTEPEQVAVSSLAFAQQKGRLIMPAIGDISAAFGWYDIPGADDRGFRRGVDIDATPGADVRAVYAGQVRRAEWIRGFGNAVILDHGEGYFTIYAHLDAPAVSVGGMVTTGQILGHVGDTGSTRGPYLHFQVRHHSDPVDPLDWIEVPPGIQVVD